MPFTRNEILNEALELIGAKPLEQAANAADLLTLDNTLRQLVRRIQATGAHLFSQNEAAVFLQPGQVQYQLGNSSSDHATEDFTETTLSAAASSGATTASLTVSTGLAVSNSLGIRLDDGTRQWVTVSSLGPLVFTPALTDDAASGNTVFFYTTDLGKALRIPRGRRVNGSGSTSQEIELVVYGKSDYENLPNKATSGTPTVFYYDPKQISGNLFIWPAPASIDNMLKITYYKPLDPYASAADEGVFPDEWGQMLSYNLAALGSPKFPGFDLHPDVKAMAFQMYSDMLDWDQESSPVRFEPGRGFGYGG